MMCLMMILNAKGDIMDLFALITEHYISCLQAAVKTQKRTMALLQ